MLILVSVLLATFSFSRVSGIRCYVCNNVDDPEDCSRIGECSTGQLCHIRYYENTLGFKVFDLGCRADQFCKAVTNRRREAERSRRQSDIVLWNECCSEDYCNIDYNNTRNDTLFKNDHSNLRCFTCEHVNDPAECDTVHACGRGEACFTYEKTNHLGEHGFGMTCKSKRICEKIPPHPTFEKSNPGSVDMCQGCCDLHSHCNSLVCSKVLSGATIPVITPAVTTPTPYLYITSGPSNQTVLPGSTVVFDCQAYGYPTLNVTWMFTHTNMSSLLVVTAGVTATSTGSQLTITNVTENDIGHYVCFAQGNQKTASMAAELQFTAYLNITSGPSNQTVLPGSTVVFDCQAYGYPTLNVTWMFTHTNMSSLHVVTAGVTATSAGSQLTITNVTENDIGHYVCFAQGNQKTASMAAELQFTEYLNITSGPSNQTVLPGSTVVFDCQAYGYPTLNVTWMFTHTNMSSLHVVTAGVTATSAGSQLTITNVTENDVGHYVCFAQVNKKTASMAAELQFTEFLNITKGPSDLSVKNGESATFTCDVSGYPLPTVTWLFTHNVHVNLTVVTSGVKTTSTGSKLTIDHVTDNEIGTYVCFASNSLGKQKEKADLKFGGVPVITQSPHSQKVNLLERVELPCTATGDPKPDISWSFSSISMPGPYLPQGVLFSLIDKTLIFPHMLAKFAGNYTCSATNTEGTATATATLFL